MVGDNTGIPRAVVCFYLFYRDSSTQYLISSRLLHYNMVNASKNDAKSVSKHATKIQST